MRRRRGEMAGQHEAGHAVTALAFRVPVRSASIRPRKATFGRVITPRLPDKDVDIEIYIALAGPFAHRRFAPGSNWLTGDFAIAEKLSGKGCSGTPRNKEKYAAYIVDHAEGFVDYFWADIKGAAKALLKHDTLPGDEILKAIRAARRKSRRRRRIGDPPA